MKTEMLQKMAELFFPELQQKGFFTTVNGTECYYAGLQNKKVERYYKTFYDEYDQAFCLQCTFRLCDFKKGSQWIRKEGKEHLYNTPVVYVVMRDEMNLTPAQIVKRMRTHYRANALVLGGYIHDKEMLSAYLKQNGIYFAMTEQLHRQRELKIPKLAQRRRTFPENEFAVAAEIQDQ